MRSRRGEEPAVGAMARRSFARSIIVFLAIVFLAIASRARSQETPPEKPEPSAWTAVRDATVHPVRGAPFRRGTVLWKDGKIVEVGRDVEIPAGTTVHDGSGLHVTPGLVAILAQGVGLESAPGRLEHRLDPFDLSLRIALANGITTAHVLGARPPGGFAADSAPAGDSAVIRLTPGELGTMHVREPVCQFWSLPGRQLPLALHEMRDRFRRARRFLEELAEAKEKKKAAPRLDRDLGPYVEILRNERPTVVSVRDNEELRILLELKREYGFDLILHEPDDAWLLAPTLAAEGVSVWVKTRGRDFQFGMDTPILEEGDMAPVRRANAFARAGVGVSILPYRRVVSLIGLAGRDLTTLALDAAFAVRGGMSEVAALEAITLQPARDLRLDTRIGSLERGKDADVLIWSGPPLGYRSWVLQAFVQGKLVYDRDAERLYREIPLSRPADLSSDGPESAR